MMSEPQRLAQVGNKHTHRVRHKRLVEVGQLQWIMVFKLMEDVGDTGILRKHITCSNVLCLGNSLLCDTKDELRGLI